MLRANKNYSTEIFTWKGANWIKLLQLQKELDDP